MTSTTAMRNYIARYSKKTKAPLLFRMVVFFHSGKQDGYKFKNDCIPVYDWFENHPKEPNYKYFEKKLLEWFGSTEREEKYKDQLVFRACLFPNTGPQEVIREYRFEEILLDYTFKQIAQKNCTHSKAIVRQYWKGMRQHPKSAYKIATALANGFEQTDWSATDNEEVKTFFIRGLASLKIELEKLKD